MNGLEDIPKVVETVWPVNLRQTVNWIAKRMNRPWTVQIEDNAAAEFLVSEENVILVLPSSAAGSFNVKDIIAITEVDGVFTIGLKPPSPNTAGKYVLDYTITDGVGSWGYAPVALSIETVCVHDDSGVHVETETVLTLDE